MMRYLMILLLCAPLCAQEALPWREGQPGYHNATLELARFCLEHNLVSECRLLVRRAEKALPEPAAALVKQCEDKTDSYTAANWGAYLDKREAVQWRRAAGAHAAGTEPQWVLHIDPEHAPSHETLGRRWLEGVGWLDGTEHERLAPLVLREFAFKPEREAIWEKPWVLLGKHFTLVTDLTWERALKYSGLLDQFHAAYFDKLGDVIPRRKQPNVVWCCKSAATFVKVSAQMGFPMPATNAGLHVGALSTVIINAERSDEVGRKNKARDNLARTMFHECAHRLTEIGLRGRNPSAWELSRTTEHAWIVESIAVVFEDLHFEKGAPVLRGLEDQRKYTIEKHWKGKTGKVPALMPVLGQGQADFASDQPISNAEKYALAGSVAWFCLFENAGKHRAAYLGLLVDYYRADTRGRDFEARFGLKAAEFESEWRVWVVK